MIIIKNLKIYLNMVVMIKKMINNYNKITHFKIVNSINNPILLNFKVYPENYYQISLLEIILKKLNLI